MTSQAYAELGGNPHDPQPALPRLGYWPGTECPKHRHYPQPCDRCARDADPSCAREPGTHEVTA